MPEKVIMDSLTKGSIGEAKAIESLLKSGWQVYLPFSCHSAFDIIAYREPDEFLRVQVKYRKKKNETIRVDFRNVHCNSKGHVTKSIDKDLIDVYCVYCPDTDECYFLDPKDFGQVAFLRFSEPKNGQVTNIRWAKDYTHWG